MRITLSSVVVLLLLTSALADSPKGLKPRENVTSYPVHRQRRAVAIGAERLSNTQVQHAFAAELDKRYIVVEIGIFPATDGSVSVAPRRLHAPGSGNQPDASPCSARNDRKHTF